MSSRINVQIQAMRLEAAGVLSLELAAEGGGELPPWNAGAHIDLHLPSGLIRQYSLCADPAERRHYRIAVRLEQSGCGGSREVHQSLLTGQTVTIGEPRNHFALQPESRYLFVAAGIGITPLLSMAYSAEKQNADWTLLYGGRSRKSMAFTGELQRLGGGRVEILAKDEGRRLNLDAILATAEQGTTVYSCGPPALLDALSERFGQAGLAGCLRMERFTPAAIKPANGEAGSFRLILARRGIELTVPAGCSILQTLREAGIDVPCSCEQGICGTCETRVLDGIPDHQDHLLSAREKQSNQSMMLCVSRALSESLTLDL